MNWSQPSLFKPKNLGAPNKRQKGLATRPAHRRTFENVPGLLESIGWCDNAVLTGINFKRLADHWLAVVKADFAVGPRVAFQRGNTLLECIENTQRHGERGGLTWSVDEFELRRRKDAAVRQSSLR